MDALHKWSMFCKNFLEVCMFDKLVRLKLCPQCIVNKLNKPMNWMVLYYNLIAEREFKILPLVNRKYVPDIQARFCINSLLMFFFSVWFLLLKSFKWHFSYTALKRPKRDVTFSYPAPPIVHTVPNGFPFYLSCPIDSHHATYSWKHRDNQRSIPCQRTQSDCLHLIPDIHEHDYGMYNCVSREHNYDKIIKVYKLHAPAKPQSPSKAFKLTAQKEWLLAVFIALLFSVQ